MVNHYKVRLQLRVLQKSLLKSGLFVKTAYEEFSKTKQNAVYFFLSFVTVNLR